MPQLLTIAVTLGLTWETNQLMMMFTPAKPMPTIRADLTSVLNLMRKMSPSTRMIRGIMHIGPMDAIV